MSLLWTSIDQYIGLFLNLITPPPSILHYGGERSRLLARSPPSHKNDLYFLFFSFLFLFFWMDLYVFCRSTNFYFKMLRMLLMHYSSIEGLTNQTSQHMLLLHGGFGKRNAIIGSYTWEEEREHLSPSWPVAHLKKLRPLLSDSINTQCDGHHGSDKMIFKSQWCQRWNMNL